MAGAVPRWCLTQTAYGYRRLSLRAFLSSPRGLQRQPKPELQAETLAVHVPVMRDEVLAALSPKDKQVFVDMTFGAGGHTRALLQQAPNIQVYALDRDPAAYDLAKEMANNYRGHLNPLLGRFSELESLLQGEGLGPDSVDGILVDAGCSSLQFDTAERGFAISKNGPLDMRMDGDRVTSQPTAADVVNTLDALTIMNIIKTYGEEPHAKKIAAAIVKYRQLYQPIATTSELATVIACAFTHTESRRKKDMIGRPAHVATKTFQGLRIFVNNELNELSAGLEAAGKLLRPGGKLAILSFHSLEDRIVKRFFQGRPVNEAPKTIHQQKRDSSESTSAEGDIDNKCWDSQKGVVTPTEEEIERNPRSRSAKLRVAIKL